MVSYVCCSNNTDLFSRLEYSLKAQKGRFPGFELIKVSDPISCGAALNRGIEQAQNNIVITVHQDVILSPTFNDKLIKKIEKYSNFGIMGVAGITSAGQPWGGLNGWTTQEEGPVEVLDECVMVLRKDSGLRYDERFGWHAYGADICLQATAKGLINYALDLQCEHPWDRSKDMAYLRKTGYWKDLGQLKDKYGEIDIRLTHAEIKIREIRTLTR